MGCRISHKLSNITLQSNVTFCHYNTSPNTLHILYQHLDPIGGLSAARRENDELCALCRHPSSNRSTYTASTACDQITHIRAQCQGLWWWVRLEAL